MSTLRATNIKHELSATNQIVLGADGSIGGTLGDTLAAKAAISQLKILQVVAATSTTATAVTSTTPTDTTLTATITPSSATSKILVLIDQSIQISNSASMGAGLRVVRGATVISSDDTYQTIYNSGFAGSFTLAARAGFCILDSPATTSATTYKTQVRREAGSGTVTVQYGSSQSQITLLEVAA